MRRTLLSLAAAGALVALVAVGLSQTHTRNAAPVSAAPSAAQVRTDLAGSPPALAALHAQSSQLLSGSPATVRGRLATLRGNPVVVNKWAAWCGPCRAEFPFLQQASARLGARVGFLGVDGADNAADAHAFLRRFPVSYPSYADPSEAIARALGVGSYYPATIFLGRDGSVAYVHQGAYPSQMALETDIRRYLGVA